MCSLWWGRKMGWWREGAVSGSDSGIASLAVPAFWLLNCSLETEDDTIYHKCFGGFIHGKLLKTMLGNKQTKTNGDSNTARDSCHQCFISAPSLNLTCPAQAQRRSREQSRSASALSISGGEEKSEHSEGAHLSTYSNGGIFFSATSTGTSGWRWLWQHVRPAHWQLL